MIGNGDWEEIYYCVGFWWTSLENAPISIQRYAGCIIITIIAHLNKSDYVIVPLLNPCTTLFNLLSSIKQEGGHGVNSIYTLKHVTSLSLLLSQLFSST